MKQVISGLTAAALVLGGCASGGGIQAGHSGGGSPLRAHMSDYQRTVAEGAVVGAIAGGLIGFVASGGDQRRLVQNVATGVVAGGMLGGGAGLVIAGQKQSYASREQALDAVIKDGSDRVARLSRLVNASQHLIAQRRQELARVKAMKAGSAEHATAKRQLIATLEADQAALVDANRMVDVSHAELLRNIQQVKAQFPAGVPPSVDGIAKDHESKGLDLKHKTPEELNRVISQAKLA